MKWWLNENKYFQRILASMIKRKEKSAGAAEGILRNLEPYHGCNFKYFKHKVNTHSMFKLGHLHSFLQKTQDPTIINLIIILSLHQFMVQIFLQRKNKVLWAQCMNQNRKLLELKCKSYCYNKCTIFYTHSKSFTSTLFLSI